MFNWFRKTADPMQQVQHDPTPTLKEMDAVAAVLRDQRDFARAAHSRAVSRSIERTSERNAAWEALRKIAAMETPGSAPAAKRMARIAREALPEYAAADREAA